MSFSNKNFGLSDSLIDTVRKIVSEQTEYQKFFSATLKKFGVTSPSQLKGDKEKEFYDYIDKNWKGKDEKPEANEEADEGKLSGKKEKITINPKIEEELSEEAKSKAQQKLMAMALAYKRGEMDDASDEVKKLADSMSEKDLEDFAKTKHKGLPDKVEEEKAQYLDIEVGDKVVFYYSKNTPRMPATVVAHNKKGGLDVKIKGGKVFSLGPNHEVDYAETMGEAYEEEKVTCTKCDGEGCEHCDNKGYHIEEAYKSPAEAAAFEDGKKAARKGKKYSDNPHKKGTPEHLYWSKGHNKIREEVELEEAKSGKYQLYHMTYSSAVQTALKMAQEQGYEVDMEDYERKVAFGPKKPSSGKTNSFSIKLLKNGKPAKQALQIQVYNMDNKKYELNTYIS